MLRMSVFMGSQFFFYITALMAVSLKAPSAIYKFFFNKKALSWGATFCDCDFDVCWRIEKSYFAEILYAQQ